MKGIRGAVQSELGLGGTRPRHGVIRVESLPRLILDCLVGEVDTAAEPDEVEGIAVIQRKLARFPGIDHATHRCIAGIEQGRLSGHGYGFRHGSQLQRQVQLEPGVDVDLDPFPDHTLKTRLLGLNQVHTATACRRSRGRTFKSPRPDQTYSVGIGSMPNLLRNLSLRATDPRLFPSEDNPDGYQQTFKTVWRAHVPEGRCSVLPDLRSEINVRNPLSAGGVADADAAPGDAKVFKKYSQMKLQMKREALQKLNRYANESGKGSGTIQPN